MAKVLKAVIDSLDQADEADRDYYVEKDGKFFANIQPVGGVKLEDVSGLLSALGKEKESARDALAKLSEFGDLNPKEAREALFKMKDAANWKPAAKVQEQIDAATAELKKAAGTKEAELQATIDSLSGQLDEVLIDSEVKTLMSLKEVDGKPNPFHGHAHLILPEVHRMTETRQNADGKRETVVKDAAGNARYTDGQGSLFKLSGLLGELKDDPKFAPAFAGVNAGGGGMPPNSPNAAGAKVVSRAAFESMSPEARMSHTQDGGTVTD